MTGYHRYAVFYVPPPDEALAQFGAGWLGRDIRTGDARLPDDPPPGWNRLTARPRKYGFHGTLKAPFELAEDKGLPMLREAVGAVAERFAAFDCAPLRLTPFGRILALVPERPSAALDALAAECVTALDPFRAPMDDAERARRRGRGLSAREEAYLAQWGYPHVLEEFRFHLTLTGAVPEDIRPAIEADLQRRTAPLCTAPFRVDALTLCGEAITDGRFRVIERFALGGG